MIELGRKVKDKITSFKGMAVARCEYLSSTPRIWVMGECTDPSKYPDSHWVDEVDVEYCDGKIPKIVATEDGIKVDLSTDEAVDDNPNHGETY